MRKQFGRHRSSYKDLQPTKDVKPEKAKVVPCDNRLRNVANADFERNRLRFDCWPATRKDGRRWGTYQQEQAVILHFKMRAQHDKSVRLDEFELSMTFSLPENGVELSLELDATNIGDAPSSTEENEIALIDVPSPDHVEGTGRQSRDSNKEGSWSFRGSSLGSPSPGAKWLWEANTLETPMLHTAIALVHRNQPFLGRCHVKGRATRLQKKFKFDNDTKPPVYVQLNPENSDECLEELVGELNALIKARIFENLEQSAPGMSMPSAQKTYGPTNVDGSANVHLGDTFHVYNNPVQGSLTSALTFDDSPLEYLLPYEEDLRAFVTT